MSTTLRMVMILIAILFLGFVFSTVNRKKLLLKYSLIWIITSLGMLVVAVFPKIAVFVSKIVGIEITSNFVYLFGIVFLLIISFSLTIIVSQQTTKIKTLIQLISIDKYEENRYKNESGKMNEKY